MLVVGCRVKVREHSALSTSEFPGVSLLAVLLENSTKGLVSMRRLFNDELGFVISAELVLVDDCRFRHGCRADRFS